MTLCLTTDGLTFQQQLKNCRIEHEKIVCKLGNITGSKRHLQSPTTTKKIRKALLCIKIKAQSKELKVTLSMCWDSQGVILTDFLQKKVLAVSAYLISKLCEFI